MLVRKIQSQPRGFTLLELLIVVVILTVLSSIVLPQFSDMTMDARQSVVNKNVQLVQAALDRYAVEHGGYPNNNTWKNWCPSLDRRHRIGTGYTFLINRLTLFSNGEHQVCDSRQDGGYRYGPYLRKSIPVNPFHDSAAVRVMPLDDRFKDTEFGWIYHQETGQFLAPDPD